MLEAHGVRFGLENHPERTPSEVLEAIGDVDVLGAAVDTGWWATQGYDPVAAIDELSERLFHVHLKDVEEPGTHVTCMYGQGCATDLRLRRRAPRHRLHRPGERRARAVRPRSDRRVRSHARLVREQLSTTGAGRLA